MNFNFYAGHSFEWTEKFINATPKKKGLDYAKSVSIAEVLQHRYVIEKKREVSLDTKTLRRFGINTKNLQKYLPFFENAGLIKWIRKRGAAPKIHLVSLPPNYKLNNKKEIIKEKRYNKIKGINTTVSHVTRETVSHVDEKPFPTSHKKRFPTLKKGNKESKEDGEGRKLRQGAIVGMGGSKRKEGTI